MHAERRRHGCGPSPADLGSYRSGAGGVAAAEAKAEEAVAAARCGDLRRPGTACCRAAGDGTAAAVVVPLLPRFCRSCRRRRRAAAVAADAGVVLR